MRCRVAGGLWLLVVALILGVAASDIGGCGVPGLPRVDVGVLSAAASIRWSPTAPLGPFPKNYPSGHGSTCHALLGRGAGWDPGREAETDTAN